MKYSDKKYWVNSTIKNGSNTEGVSCFEAFGYESFKPESVLPLMDPLHQMKKSSMALRLTACRRSAFLTSCFKLTLLSPFSRMDVSLVYSRVPKDANFATNSAPVFLRSSFSRLCSSFSTKTVTTTLLKLFLWYFSHHTYLKNSNFLLIC